MSPSEYSEHEDSEPYSELSSGLVDGLVCGRASYVLCRLVDGRLCVAASKLDLSVRGEYIVGSSGDVENLGDGGSPP